MKRKTYKHIPGFIVLKYEPVPQTTNQKIKAWLQRLKEEVTRN
jgi:hypothetical protein